MTDDEYAVVVAQAVNAVLGFPATVPGWDPPGGTPRVVPPGPSTRTLDASAAAVAITRRYLWGTTGDVFPDPAVGPDLYAGVVTLAVRIYHDPSSPGGVVGGDAYTGAAIPEDLLAHVHHYIDPYRTLWGIA